VLGDARLSIGVLTNSVPSACGDRAQHGLEDRMAVGDEPGMVPGPAVDHRTATTGVGAEELLESARVV